MVISLKIVVLATIRFAARRGNTVYISYIVIVIRTIFDLFHKSCSCHIRAGYVVMKSSVSTGAAFLSNSDSLFSHTASSISRR